MSKRINLALIGFGGVNQGLVKLIASKEKYLLSQGINVVITAVADLRLGIVACQDGIEKNELIELASNKFEAVESFKRKYNCLSNSITLEKTIELIQSDFVDVVVEATYTDPNTGEPAISHCRAALTAGKHVITTNKGPIAIAYPELKKLADINKAEIKFEGTVMSGTPVINQFSSTLRGCEINGFAGILNGTSNFVLSKVAAGSTFESAIKEAQELGYAEANPAADIEGYDVQLKVIILANTLWGAQLTRSDVPTKGISCLTSQDVQDAIAQGKTWRLIGSAQKNPDGSIIASVAPQKISNEHPLSAATGVTNAITIETDVLGKFTITGPGAGIIETAYAIFSDLISLVALK